MIEKIHLSILREISRTGSLTAAANKLMLERRLDPCMSECFPWEEIPAAVQFGLPPDETVQTIKDTAQKYGVDLDGPSRCINWPPARRLL